MDNQHLQRRTALAIEGQGPKKTFLHRKLDVGVRQNDGGVLGVETKNCPQAMRLRMQFFQMIGDLARSDERQHVHLPRIEQTGHDHRTAPVDRVDDPFGNALRNASSSG